MNRLLWIVIPYFIANSSVMSQPADIQTQPLTKIEEMLTTNGTFIEKDFMDVGKIGCKDSEDLIIKALVLYEPQNDERTFGIILEIFSVQKFKALSRYTAYIDLVDIDPLISALEVMKSKSDSLINESIEYKEIIYRLSNGIRFGFYQKQKRGKPSQTGFCIFNDWDSDARVYFGLNRLSELIALLKGADRKLIELGA